MLREVFEFDLVDMKFYVEDCFLFKIFDVCDCCGCYKYVMFEIEFWVFCCLFVGFIEES